MRFTARNPSGTSASEAGHAALLSPTLALGAWAQSGLDIGSAQLCKADARKLRRGIKPGGGRMVTCPQRHEAGLLAAFKATLPPLTRCGEQFNRGGGEGGRPREFRACTQANRSELAGFQPASAPQS